MLAREIHDVGVAAVSPSVEQEGQSRVAKARTLILCRMDE
jgi:hypothetical protein